MRWFKKKKVPEPVYSMDGLERIITYDMFSFDEASVERFLKDLVSYKLKARKVRLEIYAERVEEYKGREK